jgi:hypothetical protein
MGAKRSWAAGNTAKPEIALQLDSRSFLGEVNLTTHKNFPFTPAKYECPFLE